MQVTAASRIPLDSLHYVMGSARLENAALDHLNAVEAFCLAEQRLQARYVTPP